MHAGEQHGLDEGPPPARVGLTQGIVVIVLAVLIGGFLLLQAVDDPPQEVAAGEASDTTLSSEGQVADETAGPVTGSTTGSSAAGGTSVSASGSNDDTDASTDASAADGATDDDGTATTASATTASSAPATTAGPATSVTGATTGSAGTTGVTVLVLNAASTKGVAGKGTELLDDAGFTMMAPKNADALGPSRILYTSGNEAQAEAVAAALEADTGLIKALDPSAPPIRDYGAADVIVVIGTDGAIDVTGG